MYVHTDALLCLVLLYLGFLTTRSLAYIRCLSFYGSPFVAQSLPVNKKIPVPSDSIFSSLFHLSLQIDQAQQSSGGGLGQRAANQARG